jgi:hypothetical protein
LDTEYFGQAAKHSTGCSMESELTIIIVVDLTGEVDGSLDTDIDTMRSWRAVKSKLYSLLLELRIRVVIELIDQNAFRGFLVSPVLSTDTKLIQA